MELDAIRAHKDALAQHIATWLLDFSTKTGVPVTLEAKPVIEVRTNDNGQHVPIVKSYDVTMIGMV